MIPAPGHLHEPLLFLQLHRGDDHSLSACASSKGMFSATRVNPLLPPTAAEADLGWMVTVVVVVVVVVAVVVDWSRSGSRSEWRGTSDRWLWFAWSI